MLMRIRWRSMALFLGIAIAVLIPTASAAGVPLPGSATKPRPSMLALPGNMFFPESIAAAPDGTLYTSSVGTGAIVDFPSGSATAQTLVPAGVNTNTAGLFFDRVRDVLWSCSVSLTFSHPTALQAWNPNTGALEASYAFPAPRICADIAIGPGGDIFATDTTNPTVSPPAQAAILRLTTPSPTSPNNGTLTVWSTDPAFTGPKAGFQINGIAFDGGSNIYTNNLANGDILRVPINPDGSAGPAQTVLPDGAFTDPDGIRMLDDPNQLLVTEDVGRLSLVNVATGTVTLINGSLDQPSSVVRVGHSLWLSLSQIIRAFQGVPPNLPFMLQRLPVPAT